MQTITETFPQHVHELNVQDITPGTVQEIWLHLINNGIVIGKSVSPINQTGSRILHLGLNPVEIPCIVDEL